MSRGWRHIILAISFAAISAISFSPSARAQEQTVEGAQRFLDSLARSNQLWQIVADSEQGLRRNGSTRWNWVRAQQNGCTSRVNLGGHVTEVTGAQIDVFEVNVEWWRWSNIRAIGSNVYVNDSIFPFTMFRFSSSDMASRVAYAMEFLRQNCDPHAGTGF